MSKESCHPSISKSAFDCPHCGECAAQNWFGVYNSWIGDFVRSNLEKKTEKSPSEETETPEERVPSNRLKSTGIDSICLTSETLETKVSYIRNLKLSKCNHCNEVAVWVGSKLVCPNEKPGVPPNSDLPDDITYDYEEARSILNESPRGAAALLRLCVQKLLEHLGEKGKNINDDIASLVGKGLHPLIQKSLDIVRVIGNEAVHPGTLELKDDRETALTMLRLVDLIADQMISIPKAVQEIYDQLPEDKREAIEKRDKKSNPKG